jgi:hypothetical protein
MNAAKLPDSAYLVTKAPVGLFDGTATASMTLGIWPSGRTGRMKATVSSVTGHTDCAGTLVLGTETLTFTQAGTKLTTVNLTVKPVASSANLDCHLHITVVDTGGADIMAETLTAIDINFADEQEYYSQAIGGFVKRPAQAITDNDTCLVGDIIRYNLVDYQIKAIHVKKNRLGLELFRIMQF